MNHADMEVTENMNTTHSTDSPHLFPSSGGEFSFPSSRLGTHTVAKLRFANFPYLALGTGP